MDGEKPRFTRKVKGIWQVKIDVPSRMIGWVLNKKGRPVKTLVQSLRTNEERVANTRAPKVIQGIRRAMAAAEMRRLQAIEREIRDITDYTPQEMAARLILRLREERLRRLGRRIRSGN